MEQNINTTTSAAENSIPTAEVVFSSNEIIPGNLAISSDSHIYFTVNPLLNPSSKLYKITGDTKAVPFPNDEYSSGDDSIIGGTIGVRIDSHNNLWILDMNKRQFIVWNLDKNELSHITPIPSDVTKTNSFLQDFIIDEKRKRIIIADMTMGSEDNPVAPAFVVYDIASGKMSRIAENHPTLLSDVEGGFDLNPIAIDPDCEWIYFGASSSHKLYRVAANTFDSEANLINSIELFSEKSFCDGIVADNNGVVYVTNVDDNAIGVATKDGFSNIAMLPDGQAWPDGLYISPDGYVYSTVSQLSRAAILNDGKDLSIAPYIIVRTPKIK